MQKKIYLAHTANEKKEVHSLYDHLINTAYIATGFAFNKDMEEILKVAGLLHDLGKYQDEFQNYLLKGGRRGSVPHAKWGAMLARKLSDMSKDKGYQELSFCIDGHHAGIPDYSKWDKEHTYIPDDDIETKSKLKDLLRTFLDETQLEQKDLLINESIETEVLQGEGKAYGVEFLIKKTKGRLNGWLAYTYSRSKIKFDSEFSEERINNGELFPSNCDKPQDGSLISNYKCT
ncbi:MAG: CRISPR-associated endonuclease Cas3'', partial [Spirochaetales bacterium]|nr:CRISPR-associated endonuclease Cas3'' [Spirochaetales bacterium]